MSERVPAEVFPLAEYLADEMEARGWTSSDVAARMSDRCQWGIRLLAFELLLCVQDDNLIIDDQTFAELARVFDVSEQYFRNLHEQWKKYPDRRSKFECPEHLLTEQHQ